MHTLLQHDDSTCSVGSWQIGPQGHAQFVTIFTVENFEQAIALCNVLNGGPPGEAYYRLINSK